MAEQEKVINVDGDTRELIIRNGDAPEVNNPLAVRIAGHIDSPYNYFEARVGITFDFETAHLEVDTQNKAIKLYCDPSDELAPIIRGEIREYGPLKKLGINSDKIYSKDAFKQLMKRNRFLFKDASDCTALVSKLSSLDVKVQQQLKDADDDRGNRQLHYEQTCQSELPETITLHSQIFVEGDKQDITIDLCFNVNGSAEPQFWLESPTLFEIIEEQTTKMIADTVADFNDEIAIIYK